MLISLLQADPFHMMVPPYYTIKEVGNITRMNGARLLEAYTIQCKHTPSSKKQ
jgi:hypothetical protein